MPTSPTLSRHELRQLLRAALPTDSDLGAFCLDFFPQAAERFASNMDRLAKLNLLFELEDSEEIFFALRQYAPSRLAQYEQRRGAKTVSQKNPYRGLAAFQLEDACLFYGREVLTSQLWQQFEALYEKMDAVRLLAIIGPSGSGKSSLARAGLLAALVQSPVPGPQPLRIAIVKPGEQPIESLARALVPLLPVDSTVLPASRQVAIEKLLKDKDISAQGLRRFATDLPDIATSPLCIFVDQFEELYTLCKDPNERDSFVENLLHAASESSRHVSIVLTLRSDFIGDTQRHHNTLNRLIAQHGVIVPALSPEELRDAIAKPAEQSGRPLDLATLELLLVETRDSQGALPLLEFTLTRIWEAMERGVEPSATLRKLGGVGGALAGEAQKIYESLSERDQATAQRALVRLVRLGEGTRDSRRRAPLSELCGRGETETTVLAVLRKFATENARLVTLSSEGVETLAEVTHEALFDHWTELRAWIEQGRKDRGLYDRALAAAKLWTQAGRQAGRLWRPPDLSLLREYHRRKPEDFGQLPTEFLAAAKRRQTTEQVLSLGAVAAVLAAFFVAAFVYVYKARQVSEANNQIHEQLLESYIDKGRQLLFESGQPSEGLLWLHRAQLEGSKDAALPDLLTSAIHAAGAPRAVLIGHSNSVLSATYSPDGRHILTTSADKTARVWAADSGRLVVELKGHGGVVWSGAYDPNGRRIVTTSADKTARVWAADSGQLVVELKGHGDSVNSAMYSPDGGRIVTTSNDRTARAWEADSGRLVAELKGHGDKVLSATYSPDSRYVVTSSADKTARVWDADSGLLVAELKGHEGKVLSATYSPDGRRIVTVDLSVTARLWDVSTGRLVAKLVGREDIGQVVERISIGGSRIGSAMYSPDGRRIVTTNLEKTARVWEATSGRLLAELKGHASSVNSATYSPDGRRIVTASADKTARVWVADSGRLVTELNGHSDSVLSATYNPDGHRIVTASDDHTARVWEADNGRLVAELKGHGHRVVSATYNPDGRRIATASWDNTARVWEAGSGRLVAELKGHGGFILNAIYSPDGHRIVTASSDKTARVWEADSGRLVTELKGHKDSVRNGTYSPDGRRIVTVSSDKTARVWEADSGRLVAELQGHGNRVNGATYSPDGRRIVTTADDYTPRVWDADSGRLIAELRGHRDSVNNAMYSPDGRHIATTSDDDTALIWEAESGRLVAELKGHGASVLSAIYSPDGHYIVTAGHDKTARVWDIALETLSLEQIANHIRCRVPFKFAPNNKNFLIHNNPTPERCMDAVPLP